MLTVRSQVLNRETQTARGILNYVPPSLRSLLEGLPDSVWCELEEVRLRVNRPLLINLTSKELLVDRRGQVVGKPGAAYLVTADDLVRTLQLVTGSSLYAVEEELRSGYVTVSGGHRVGIVGRTVMDGDRIQTMKQFTGINVRISREVTGAADTLMPYLLDGLRVRHTLIVSPPGCGKTTILRDVARLVSDGVASLGFPGLTVGLVDERSELAGCYRGVPQRDVGLRTDVLDACPKALGMFILLRAMAPRVIVTDEIGRTEDVSALEEVINAGVTIISTAHAASLDELLHRPVLKNILAMKVFERLVMLGRSRGPGTIEKIVNGQTMRVIGSG
ncbi:MAG: stage III sporulation protein AA [Clostridia bacterium]|nr:stage III sporulation protein AA [Clostridia bacterium]